MKENIWARRIHEPFILASLGIALTAGFGYAVILVEALGHQVTLGAWWAPLVQAHGHAQLFGWFGLFVIGMGLYFLPRLAGARLAASDRAPYAFGLLVGGIVLRSVSQPTLGFVEAGSETASAARIIWLVSALMELGGLLVVGSMIKQTVDALAPIREGAPAWPVIPFIATAAVSFALAILLNAVATWFAFLEKNAAMDGLWDGAIIQLVLFGTAVPMAFAFSVRNLPLYMRLAAPPRREFRWIAGGYVIGLILRLSSFLPYDSISQSTSLIAALGWILQGAIILIFIWELDIFRRKPAWVTERMQVAHPEPDELRRPTRPGYPDAGEYGRFELLIYSAYVWLAVVALIGIVRGASVIAGIDPFFSTDMERHALTIGFISLLIFGMAVRMAPGFSGQRRVAYPRLVAATLVLGNLAAIFRVLPLLAPQWDYATLLLAPSGGLGWAAVLLLAINLTQTFKLTSPSANPANSGVERSTK